MKTHKKPILIMFGGQSPEHEVSVITGLQVIAHIDRDCYIPMPVYIDKKGKLFLLPKLKTKKDFLTTTREAIIFGNDSKGGFIQSTRFLSQKIYPYAAYLAFHGGPGEQGMVQGLLATLGIPYTSSTPESLAITMNKKVTKTVVEEVGIQTVASIALTHLQIQNDIKSCIAAISEKLGFPVIIKPVHFGSSIGISIAQNIIEAEKALLMARHLDTEIIVEKFVEDFTEYNCAVRQINNAIEVSAIEEPISHDDILSFADKYEHGSKKIGGMAGLSRNVPARISQSLQAEIEHIAQQAFIACRCKGMVRIDFMYANNSTLYLTEINPIPGSMSYYLWEASGVSFKKQITDLIEQSHVDHMLLSNFDLDYETDIVKKFISAQ